MYDSILKLADNQHLTVGQCPSSACLYSIHTLISIADMLLLALNSHKMSNLFHVSLKDTP